MRQARTTTATIAYSEGGLAQTPVGTFVALGSSSKYRFERLLRAVLLVRHDLPKPLLIQGVQAEFGDLPDDVEAVEFVPHERYQTLLRCAQLVICHAGAGTLLAALRAGTPTIAMARRREMGEVADDHQLELAEQLKYLGLIELAGNAEELRLAALALQTAAPAPGYSMRTHALLNTIADELRFSVGRGALPRIALVASSGGHLTELRELERVYGQYPHFYVVSKFVGNSPEMSGRTYVFPTDERDWRMVFTTLAVIRMLWRERPDVVLSTGSGSALPTIMLSKLLLGAKVIYVESVARVQRPSPAGRFAYLFADRFFYQWPSLARFFPAGILVGCVNLPLGTSALELERRDDAPNKPPLGVPGWRRLGRWFRTSSASRRGSESPSST